MAISVYGVSPSMGESEWAIYQRIVNRGNWHEVVDTAADYAVTVTAATPRTVTVAAGDMVVCGTLVRSSTTQNVTLATNGSGNSRIDTIVLEVDWSGSTATAGTIKAVTGTANPAPVAPNLSRTAGTLWQVALANVTVAPSAGQLVAANIVQRTPQWRQEYVYSSAINTVTVTGAGTQELAQIAIPDKGWAYRIELEAVVGFSNVTTGGFGVITGVVNGTTQGSGRAGSNNQADATLIPNDSGSLTGPATVRLTCERSGMSDNLVSVPGRSRFQARVIPYI